MNAGDIYRGIKFQNNTDWVGDLVEIIHFGYEDDYGEERVRLKLLNTITGDIGQNCNLSLEVFNQIFIEVKK